MNEFLISAVSTAQIKNFFESAGYILLAVVVLLMMVTIHEFGHYIAGVALKFKINEFAVGFGPVVAIPKFWDKKAMARIKARRRASKIEGYMPDSVAEINKDYLFRLQRTNKRGENISLRWFPLGGFCAFAGEDEELPKENVAQENPFETEEGAESVKEQVAEKKEEEAFVPFNAMKPWKRLIVQVAGALFNIVSAVFFSILCIAIVGYSVPKITSTNPIVTEEYVTPFLEGDIIVAVDGKDITVVNGLTDLTVKNLGKEYTVTLERENAQGEVELIDVVAKIIEYNSYDKDGNIVVDSDGNPVNHVGFGIVLSYQTRHYGFWDTLRYSVPYTFDMAVDIIKVFGGLFTGDTKVTDMGGTLTTISTIGGLSKLDFRYFWVLLPLIAVNLGVFNLFPIPALDGARMVFTLIEMIFRKPVNRKVEAIIHSVGLMLLLGLVLVLDFIHLVL